ncbi:MAG TPA: HAD-IIIC family phosphatase [Jiangellales bacterium]|nr:HAD-IIIC family phosphatase [Jiangellales bacterium]
MSVDTRGREALAQLRALKRGGLGDAIDRVRELLATLDDPFDVEAAGALLSGSVARDQLAAAGLIQVPIALLGSSTLDSLPNLLTAVSIPDGLLPQARLTGYNQWRFEVMAGAPDLAGFGPRLVACLLDDSVIFDEVADPLDLIQIEERCAAFPTQLRSWARSCHEVLGGLLVLCTIPLHPLRRDRLIDYPAKARLGAAWHRMNAAILDLASEVPNTTVLSDAALAADAGRVFASNRMRHAASHAYAVEYLHAYARELARVARADAGRARKCLVLDLDNTLWGGVVGDDGVAALRMSGGYPGGAYAELQALARDLAAQGVMVAICSKNDEEIAREAITTHPDMVLREESLVAVRANWDPKPDNVRGLAKELNIGVDAMVFVDDNPVERDLMRRMLPEVATVALSSDPADFAATLAGRGDFNLLRLTDEDRNRSASYRAAMRREELQRSASSLAEYLAELGTQLSIEPLDEFNTGRIVQLFAKTNQFNLAGVRYREDDVRRHRADGSLDFYGGRLTDRFGDSGLIAALALARQGGEWRIDNFVLSCRVFSRNVEQAIVGLVLRAARRNGATAVAATFRETARNAKFATFYPELGFVAVGTDDGVRFRHDLRVLPELPEWIGLRTTEEVFDVR